MMHHLLAQVIESLLQVYRVCLLLKIPLQHHFSHAMIHRAEASIQTASRSLCPLPSESDVPQCINICCPRQGVLRTAGRRSGAEPGTSATRLLSQLAVGSEDCGAPCRGGKEGEECEGHVELITYLQLLVVHGGQSRHVVGEVVGGAHVHLGV